MFLSNLSIKRPVFAAVMMLALVTLGGFSYRRLAVDLWPDVEIPYVSIITPYAGASPETVEREVSKRIEEAVNPIAGVRHVGSISREGVSTIWVEFELEVDVDDAVQEARVKVSAIRDELPRDIGEPVIQKIDFSAMPVVSLAVRSDRLPPRDLTRLAEKQVQRRVENVMGVGKVDLVGTAFREIEVELRPDRLEALGLGVNDVVGGLAGENVNVPVGRLNRNGVEQPVRVTGKPARAEDYASLVIAEIQGRPVHLGQVANVVDGTEERRSLALVEGRPAVALDVIKQTGANTVETVDAVKAEVAALAAELPDGVTVEIVRDGSRTIREAVHDVQETLIIGALLTVFIVFLFLNSWRSTVITGLTLPISVIASFIVMNFAGMTLNTMTLMALSLSIGLLIDDAIVVRENIVRHLERGQDHHTAAREGTAEIGLAVLATSLSIVAVFFPVAFMKGIVGQFFRDFGITVAFAVLVSLFVSFTLDPMLSSRWYDPDIHRTGRRHAVARLLDRFNEWFDRAADRYQGLIAWALDHRRTVMLGAAGAFLAGLAVFGALPSEFIPGYDQGEFQVSFLAAPDASIAETEGRLREVLRILEAVPEVERTYATIGAGDDGTVRDGYVYAKLVDRSQRRRNQTEIQRDVRARLAGVAGIVPTVSDAEQMDSRKPLLLSVRGEDLGLLKEYAARVKDELYKIPGVVDLESSLEAETPEYRLVVDRGRAADAGVNSRDVVETVSTLVGGSAVTTFEDEEGEAIDVRVRLPAELRRDIAQVEAVRLAVGGDGAPPALIPLGDFVRHELGRTPSQIDRQDLSREVVVSANLDDLPLGTAVAEAQKAVARVDMAPGYRVVFSGENEHMTESFGYMGEALLLAVILVYLILAAQFESFIDPLSIMLSLPLSIVGMAAMLLATGDALSIISLIGLIMLMGLVTKNAILLVDFTKTLRARGLARREALIEAGRTRLRPIMMTTLAMIFGMLPTALALGSGAEMRAPMGRAVIGGLITSTMLTLIVVPVVYSLLDDLVEKRRCAHAARAARRADQEAPVGLPASGLPSSGLPAAGPGPTALLVLALAGGSLLGAGWAATARAQAPATAAPAAATTAAVVPTAAAPETLRLALPEVARLARERDRGVLKAREYQAWVRGKYVEERAGALPVVRLEASAARQRDESQQALFGGLFPPQQDVRQAQASLTQALFTWGQVGAAIHGAKEGMAMAGDQLDTAEQDAVRDAVEAHCDVLLARELAAIAAHDLELKQRHLDEAQRKLDEGTATDYEVLAARVAVQNARPQAIRAANAVRTARDRLRYLLALEGAEVDAAGELAPGDSLAPPPDYETALAAAWANRPELAAIAHQRAVQRDLVKIHGAGDKPRLDLQAAYGQREYDIDGFTADGPYWSAGLYVSFPIFDGLRTRGKVAQARSDARAVEIEEARLRDLIALEVRTAVHAVEEARGIEAALAGTVAQARRLLEMAEAGFDLGVKTHLEVEDAQLNLMAARGNLARARRDRAVAEVTLERVQGTLR